MVEPFRLRGWVGADGVEHRPGHPRRHPGRWLSDRGLEGRVHRVDGAVHGDRALERDGLAVLPAGLFHRGQLAIERLAVRGGAVDDIDDELAAAARRGRVDGVRALGDRLRDGRPVGELDGLERRLPQRELVGPLRVADQGPHDGVVLPRGEVLRGPLVLRDDPIGADVAEPVVARQDSSSGHGRGRGQQADGHLARDTCAHIGRGERHDVLLRVEMTAHGRRVEWLGYRRARGGEWVEVGKPTSLEGYFYGFGRSWQTDQFEKVLSRNGWKLANRPVPGGTFTEWVRDRRRGRPTPQ